MARFIGGWVKNFRSFGNHWIGSDPTAYCVFTRLISWANYERTKYRCGSDIKYLERGEVLTSVAQIGESWGFSRSTVRRALNALQNDGNIAIKTTNKGTVITICNYDKYQGSDVEENQQSNQQMDNGRSIKRTSNDPTNDPHKEEVKNNKKVRSKEASTLPQASPSGVNEFIARYCEVYKTKYSVNPVIDGRTAAIAKRVVQSVGLEKSKSLVEKYLQMNDQWFITKSHDLQTFEGNLNKIELFKETGIKISQTQARDVERTESNREVIKNYFQQKGENYEG